MIILRSQRYRIYLNLDQIVRVLAWQHALRWLWNYAHAERVAKYEFGFCVPTAFEQMKNLKCLRKLLPWLDDVPRDLCNHLIWELDKSWQRGLQGISDMPRYKSKNRGDNVPMISAQGFVVGAINTDIVFFAKLGKISAVIHRLINGNAKKCALVCDGDRWYISVVYEIEIPDPVTSTRPVVGIDVGVVNIVADSNGVLHASPRAYEKTKKRIAAAQRVVAMKKEGRAAKNAPQSKNEQRARKRVAVLHRKARLQREAVLHRLSSHYAKNHGVVCVERLNLRNMTKSAKGTIEEPGVNVAQKAGLNRAILNSGMGRFVQMARYKVVPEGGEVRDVVAAHSSQECSACHHVDPANRVSQSKFECVSCGHSENADTNAAKVILHRGTHGHSGFLDVAAARPPKKQLRGARRGTRRVDQQSPVGPAAFAGR